MKILAILLLIPSIAFANPIKEMKETIVLIETRDNNQGSGVIISPNGLIITAAHVLEDRRSALIYIKNKPYKAVVAYINEKTDLALLKIKAHGLTFAKINYDYNKLDKVYSISNPKGIREVCNQGKILDTYPDKGLLYMTSSNIVNSGSSGGAIFNQEGELISMIYALSFFEESLSIPMKNFEPMIENYINNLI